MVATATITSGGGGPAAASASFIGPFALNIAQRGDALELLRSLPSGSATLGFLDPQHRTILDKLQFGNEGARQRGRAGLPAMTEEYIDAVTAEFARVLKPSGYMTLWADTYRLVEGHHLRIPRALMQPVDLIAWDSMRIGMGKRSRRRGDYAIIMQKPPVVAGSTWRDHSIPSRWIEKVDRNLHPHVKPIGLIKRLIAATTMPNDVIVDPCAGSFVTMHAALELGRNFIGCDLAWGDEVDRFSGDQCREVGPPPRRPGVAGCSAAMPATPSLSTRNVE